MILCDSGNSGNSGIKGEIGNVKCEGGNWERKFSVQIQQDRLAHGVAAEEPLLIICS